jgi:methylmalonyl-CoA mutase C-terminal domain/subunit
MWMLGDESMTTERKIRVLVANAGLDGHDVGAKTVVRAMMDAGFDVTYTGLRQSAEQIVDRVRELQPDVIGLSILSGAHLPLCRRFGELRREGGLDHIPWLVGGVIPEEDREALEAFGVDAVFAVGTPLEEIIEFVRGRVR